MEVSLKDIINAINPISTINAENNAIIINEISYNSKNIQNNDIFVCIQGEKVDGHDYAEQAVKNGAAAIIAEKKVNIDNIPLLIVKDTKLALAQASAAINNYPAKELDLIGVTGTNGKTTVTHLIEAIFEKAGIDCALIGTLGNRLSSSGDYIDTGHTTPQAPELQKSLRKIADNNIKKVVMEVSSHALEQHRVAECNFSGAVFTNLTQDHLDYHITMENYFKAKSKLFDSLKSSDKKSLYAVINKDDKYAERFISAVPEDVKVITYGLSEDSDIYASDIKYSQNGSEFTCNYKGLNKKVNLQMAGQFSIYNALAALSAGIAEGLDIDLCIDALESTPSVAGRFEIVSRSPFIIVDYAHTPDGLENVLKAAKELVPDNAKLICLFGCGGDRDVTKRPIMAKIAEQLSNKIIITSDNPRTEDTQQIITDILSGIKSLNSENIIVEEDRTLAIEMAVKMANDNDVVVIAGKGHETYQIIGDKKFHFDDREEVRNALKKLSKI